MANTAHNNDEPLQTNEFQKTNSSGCYKMDPTSVIRFELLVLPLNWAFSRSPEVGGGKEED